MRTLSQLCTPAALLACAASLSLAAPVDAQRALNVEQIGNFNSPLQVTHAPGDRTRVFVVE